jgi:hypothetical protein
MHHSIRLSEPTRLAWLARNGSGFQPQRCSVVKVQLHPNDNAGKKHLTAQVFLKRHANYSTALKSRLSLLLTHAHALMRINLCFLSPTGKNLV